MTAIERVIAAARAEIGYVEKKSNAQLDHKTANAGDGNWTKYAAFLDSLGVYNGKKNGYAWCDVFVDWCFITTFGLEIAMKMTGQPMGGYGAGCGSSANYYKQIGHFYKDKPQPGDQIFFTDSSGKKLVHTGIVEKVSGGKVYTVEGNTSAASGVVANGGMVRDKSYSLTYKRIGGYGRPDWSLVKDDEEEEEQMPRYNTMEEIKTGAGYAAPTVQKLITKGVIRGGGKKDAQGCPADMDLSRDMLRLLVMNDRAGVYGG